MWYVQERMRVKSLSVTAYGFGIADRRWEPHLWDHVVDGLIGVQSPLCKRSSLRRSFEPLFEQSVLFGSSPLYGHTLALVHFRTRQPLYSLHFDEENIFQHSALAWESSHLLELVWDTMPWERKCITQCSSVGALVTSSHKSRGSTGYIHGPCTFPQTTPTLSWSANMKSNTHLDQHIYYKGSIDSKLLSITELFFNFISFPYPIWCFIVYEKNMSGVTLKISCDSFLWEFFCRYFASEGNACFYPWSSLSVLFPTLPIGFLSLPFSLLVTL